MAHIWNQEDEGEGRNSVHLWAQVGGRCERNETDKAGVRVSKDSGLVGIWILCKGRYEPVLDETMSSGWGLMRRVVSFESSRIARESRCVFGVERFRFVEGELVRAIYTVYEARG
jgi:hypothetical protein